MVNKLLKFRECESRAVNGICPCGYDLNSLKDKLAKVKSSGQPMPLKGSRINDNSSKVQRHWQEIDEQEGGKEEELGHMDKKEEQPIEDCPF